MDKLSPTSPYWWRRDMSTPIDLYGPPTESGHEDCRHHKYGLSCRHFEQLLRRSQNRCEICEMPAEENTFGKLFIEHDHDVGRWAVRGLVCLPCNRLLAHPRAKTLAAKYLAAAWHVNVQPLPCQHATADFSAWPNTRRRNPQAYWEQYAIYRRR